MVILGSHVSMKAPDYLVGSVQEALSYGSNALMIYTGPPANSKRVNTEQLKIEQAKDLLKQNDIPLSHVIVHAPYIINLANSVKVETAQFGVEFLLKEIERVGAIGATTIVLHPGSHVGAGQEIGLNWIIKGLNEVLDQDNHDSICIALETMAGKGKELGKTFEELAFIRQGVHKKDRIKICLDTCHIHDAGYDLSNFDDVLNQFDQVIGLENLAVLHINDSKNPIGSHKDRHENIGNGFIGFDALYKVVHHPKLEGIVKILETPYIDGKAPYKEEIERLR